MSTDDAAQTVYGPRQVAEMLGLSTAMVRRYSLALEDIAGREIPVHKQRGRQFSQRDVDLLLEAKRSVDANAGLSIETALRLALGQTGLAVKIPQPPAPQLSPQVLAEALAQAQGPLLEELRGMRAELEQLRAQIGSQQGLGARETGQVGQTSPPDTRQIAAEPAQGSKTRRPGLFVRTAQRLEQWLRGAEDDGG
jgi:DNA-binding transcriptional MerR regulator